MQLLTLTLVTLSVILLTPASSGSPLPLFFAVTREPYPHQTQCTLNVVDSASGNSTALFELEDVCADRTNPNSVASLVWVPPGSGSGVESESGVVLFTTGSGSCVYAIDPSAEKSECAVTLPSSFSVLHMGLVGSAVVIVSPDGVYQVEGGKLAKVVGGLDIVGASAAAFGGRDGDSVFVAAGDHIYTISLSEKNVFTMALHQSVLNLDWYPNNATLVSLASYELYDLDAQTGAASPFFDVPDGDGYPSTHALVQNTYVFADFQFIYHVDLLAFTITAKSPFDGYFCEGGITPAFGYNTA